MAMARALRDGLEDFDLTIIYGSRTEAGIVYKKELEEVAAACDKVHVIHVLSDEEKEGYEHGFITAELIKKYGGAEYSIFMCGPQGMYNYLDTQIEPLGLAPQVRAPRAFRRDQKSVGQRIIPPVFAENV